MHAVRLGRRAAHAEEFRYHEAGELVMRITAFCLDRLLTPLADCFTPEVAAKIADLRADDATQQRIDYLAEKANEGALTGEERDEYEVYVLTIDVIAVLQAKARNMACGPTMARGPT